jgi:hypothetical protein
MHARSLAAAALAVAATLAAGGSAAASTMTLGLNTSNVGPHVELGDNMFFFPPSSISYLRGTVLDDQGKPGNSCIKTLSKPLVALDFTTDSSMSCPTDSGDGTGFWTWDVHAQENEQFKAAVWPDESNAPAESNVVTIFTAPEVNWDISYVSDRKVLDMIVDGDSDEYEGTLEVRQGSKVVSTTHISGDFADIRVPVRRKGGAGRLKNRARFSFILRPDNQDRWVAMTAKGRAIRGRQGDAGPVL